MVRITYLIRSQPNRPPGYFSVARNHRRLSRLFFLRHSPSLQSVGRASPIFPQICAGARPTAGYRVFANTRAFSPLAFGRDSIVIASLSTVLPRGPADPRGGIETCHVFSHFSTCFPWALWIASLRRFRNDVEGTGRSLTPGSFVARSTLPPNEAITVSGRELPAMR